MHFAGAHIDGADGQARVLGIEPGEVDDVGDRLAQLVDGVEGGMLDADRRVEPERHGAVGREVTRNAAEDRHPIIGGAAGQLAERRIAPQRLALDPLPEFAQAIKTHGGVIAGDDGGVDGADRGPDDPVRFDLGFVQGLIDAALIGTQSAAALKDQDHLTRQLGRLRRRRHWLMQNVIHKSVSPLGNRCLKTAGSQ